MDRVLSTVIYGEDQLDDLLKMKSIIEDWIVLRGRDSVLKCNVHFLTRDQRLKHSLEVVCEMLELKKTYNLNNDQFQLLKSVVGVPSPLTVHDTVFVPTLQSLASPEQQKLVEEARLYHILGAYAQTEIGHGSNVKGLETTATFDETTDEFVLHSPTLTSTKFWVGCLGVVATHAIVFAQMEVLGENYGVQPFFLQIRDQQHMSLPGIMIGDIGPKLGFNMVDNGYMRLDHVRVPRSQLLSGAIKVSRSGKVSRPPHAKIAYAGMVAARANMVIGSGIGLAKASDYILYNISNTREAVTISIRYSKFRRQFKKSSKDQHECILLDHQMQSYRLLSHLALSYILLFAGRKMEKTSKELKQDLAAGNASNLAWTHAVSSALKSWVTTKVGMALDDCRKCCGGHGYSLSSGIPEMWTAFTHMETAEGDNHLLTQQTTKYLLKAFQAVSAGANPNTFLPEELNIYSSWQQDLAPLSNDTPLERFDEFDFFLNSFRRRAVNCIYETATRIQEKISCGADPEDAWNDSHIEIYNAANAFAAFVVLKQAHDEIIKMTELGPTSEILSALFLLFAQKHMEIEIGSFLLSGAIQREHAALLHQKLLNSLSRIRPEALRLVNAFEFTPLQLNSVLASENDAYTELWNWTQCEPINSDESIASDLRGTVLKLLATAKSESFSSLHQSKL